MTEISAKVIADSMAPNGKRCTTMVLRYPRFIHAELMTHRAFSRNASSSRAIPAKKIIDQILTDTVVPLTWIKNQPGMQGYNLLDAKDAERAELVWRSACDEMILHAQELLKLDVHKSLVNRLLEPFAHISVVVTATEWANFFTLRLHEAAEHHFQKLADVMGKAYIESDPQELNNGEWHLPFILDEDLDDLAKGLITFEDLIKFSVARCARVSYLNHDGTKPDRQKDIDLHNKLVGSHPLHSSPAEHQATPAESDKTQSGNLIGFTQYRKLLKGENALTFPWEKVESDQ